MNKFKFSMLAAALTMGLAACGGGAEGDDVDNDMVGMTVNAQIRDGNLSAFSAKKQTIVAVRGTAFGITANANAVGQQTKIIWNAGDYFFPTSSGISVYLDNINVNTLDEEGQPTSERISDTRDPNECIVYSSSSGALTNNSSTTRSCTASFRFTTTGTWQVFASAVAGSQNNPTDVTKPVTVVIVASKAEMDNYVRTNF